MLDDQFISSPSWFPSPGFELGPWPVTVFASALSIVSTEGNCFFMSNCYSVSINLPCAFISYSDLDDLSGLLSFGCNF